MTKINTKEIKSKLMICSYDDWYMDFLHTSVAKLCDAYDEAQKEIAGLKEVTTLHCERNTNLLLEADARIATLEGLLRELLESGIEWRTDFCPSCDNHAIQGKHKPDCLFTRTQKELEKK